MVSYLKSAWLSRSQNEVSRPKQELDEEALLLGALLVSFVMLTGFFCALGSVVAPEYSGSNKELEAHPSFK
jgi:hypothetical protein